MPDHVWGQGLWDQARWDSRTADHGALTLAGGSAALRLGRGVFATNGTLRLSGQPVTFRLSRKLVAQNGSLALTGGAAALRLGRRLPAVAGTLALSGQAATLRVSHAYRLTASQWRVDATRLCGRANDSGFVSARGQCRRIGIEWPRGQSRLHAISGGGLHADGWDRRANAVRQARYSGRNAWRATATTGLAHGTAAAVFARTLGFQMNRRG